jgi:hypothetical protein
VKTYGFLRVACRRHVCDHLRRRFQYGVILYFVDYLVQRTWSMAFFSGGSGGFDIGS